jgi:meso-butanediol dehydrogenase/(S,S)-butanediol dehydrogenase/diacetyl reductase
VSAANGKRLAGKTAVITGSAGGIGAAAAELFCTNGANVVITDLNGTLLTQTARGIRERVSGASLRDVVSDVANDAEAQRVVELALEAFGGLDVLVCNAAVRHTGTVETTSVADWQRVFETNVVGAANFCRAAFPALRRSGSGSIVILSSCYALIGRKEMPIYDASKTALLSLMKSLAFDGAPHNVRANAVCPGGTITPYVLSVGAKTGKTEAEMRAERKANSLLERRAEAIEVAYPILWLASDEASYVTGSTLAVDGGLSIM